MKTSRKVLSIILTAIAAGCLCAVCVLLIKGAVDDKRHRETIDALRETTENIQSGQETEDSADASETVETLTETASSEVPQTSQTDSSLEPSESVGTAAEEEITPVENPYRDSFLANEDMAAWLQIPDTQIDYPVMWTPRDENYYLYRDFDGSKNQNGCLILDTDSCVNPLSTNLIIHGHNMRSGAMFGNLTDYEKESYYQDHKQITLYTEDIQRNYEVIAVFRSQVYKKTEKTFKFYKFFQAKTQEEFDNFYDNIKALSLYDTGVTAQFGDHFLTLSTCVYHVEQGRFVVVAKEVESGDVYLPIAE